MQRWLALICNSNKRTVLLQLLLSGIFLLASCDIITDRTLKLEGNIYIYYTAGNGLHLVEMYGSGGTDIINERISEVYEVKKIVYARAHSDVKRTDTSYYRVWYNDYSCIRVDTLTGNEFKQLTTGLQELISTIK